MVKISWIVLTWHIVAANKSAGMGPYDIDFKGLELCSNRNITNPFIYNMKHSKTTRNKRVISFDVYAPYGVNDNTRVYIDIAVKTANGYKPNFYSVEGPLVTVGRQYSPHFFSNSKSVKFPLPPGNYSVKNLLVDATLIAGIDTFFYNTYKATLQTFWKRKEMNSCGVFIIDCIPKKKL